MDRPRVTMTALTLAPLISSMGCTAGSDVDVGVGTASDELVTEQGPTTVVRSWFRCAHDPEATLVSYASLQAGGCSGTMIGPNTMITAAHCSGEPKRAIFITYDEAGAAQLEIWGTCNYLVHAFPESDAILFYCPPNAGGINPGDKYGYVDLDVVMNTNGSFSYAGSRSRLAADKPVYSIWHNMITSLPSGGNVINLYSEGTITDLNINHWAASGGTPCSDSDDFASGIRTSVWARPGASGSGQFSLDKHRYLTAPLSTAINAPDGAAFRETGSSIADIIYFARATTMGAPTSRPTCESTPGANDGARPQVNATVVSSLGLNPADYIGYLDGDLDGMFDVQRDLEALQGEAPRDYHWMNFDSIRHWKMWERHFPSQTEWHEQPYVRLNATSMTAPGWNRFLTHSGMNLQAGTYSVKIGLTNLGSSTTPLRVCMGSSCQSVSTPLAWTWHSSVATLSVPQGASVHLDVAAGADVWIDSLAIMRVDSQPLVIADFDSHGSRNGGWTNFNTNEAPWIWPSGAGSTAGSADWAAALRRDLSIANGSDMPLGSSLPLEPSRSYSICYKYRASTREPLTGRSWVGIALVGRSGTEQIQWSEVLDSTWQTVCTPSWRPSSELVSLGFVLWGGAGTILVDDIDISSTP